MDLDDLICDVQDAYFEGRYAHAIELSNKLLADHGASLNQGKREGDEEDYEGQDHALEDVYDILLASHLALGQYEDVLEQSGKWVASSGESLKQLVYTAEAAYMASEKELLEDAACKLCFLFESSGRDDVFRNAAVLGAVLALDEGLDFPETINPDELLDGASDQEPFVWWLTRKLGKGKDVPFTNSDSQAADVHRCLLTLEDPSNQQHVEALSKSEAIDATGVAARCLFCPGFAGSVSSLGLPRVHPLFRRRYLVKKA